MKVRILSALDNTVNSKYLCNFLLKEGSDLYKIFESTNTVLSIAVDLNGIVTEINNTKVDLEMLLEDIRNYSKLSYYRSDKLDLLLSDNCKDLFFNYKWLIKQLKEAEFDYTIVNIKDFNISEFQLIHIL